MSWFTAIFRDFMYLVRIVYLHIFQHPDFTQPIVYNAHIENTPVILVHGSGGNQYEWILAQEYIRKRFADHPVYIPTLDLLPYIRGRDLLQTAGMNGIWHVKNSSGVNDWSIGEYTDELEKCVLFVLHKHNADRVILIGHSMGGLVSACLESRYPEFVQRVVTISSPVWGAPLLTQFPFSSRRDKRGVDMTPNSEFLTDLHKKIGQRKDKYLSIGSVHDFLVPNDSSRFSEDHITVQGYGHHSIVNNPEIWKQI